MPPFQQSSWLQRAPNWPCSRGTKYLNGQSNVMSCYNDLRWTALPKANSHRCKEEAFQVAAGCRNYYECFLTDKKCNNCNVEVRGEGPDILQVLWRFWGRNKTGREMCPINTRPGNSQTSWRQWEPRQAPRAETLWIESSMTSCDWSIFQVQHN